MHFSRSMQAITLIVTHRTDDMSKLPPVQPPQSARAPKKATAAARPKLALLSMRPKLAEAAGNAAPPVPDMSAAAVVAPSTLAVEQPPVLPEEGAQSVEGLCLNPYFSKQALPQSQCADSAALASQRILQCCRRIR